MAEQITQATKKDLGLENYYQTDEWLASPERSWDEVDQELEARLKALEWCFSEDPDPAFRQRYGLETSPSPQTARFLSYVAVLDTQRVKKQTNQSVINAEEQVYQTQKQVIRRKYGMRGRANRDIANLDKSRNDSVKPHQEGIKIAEAVQNLFLRKAVIDILSVGDGADSQRVKAADLPKLIHESRQLVNSDRADERLSARRPVEYFINELVNYISSTKDQRIFQKYCYKSSSGLMSNSQDCNKLGVLINFALNPQQNTASFEEAGLLRSIGQACLKLIIRQADLAYSLSGVQEGSYPHLEFLYDLYTSAIYREELSSLEGLAALVDQLFSPKKNNFEVQKQCKLASISNLKNLSLVENYFLENLSVSGIITSDSAAVALLPKEFSDHICSKEFRLAEGLLAITRVLTQYRMPIPTFLNWVNKYLGDLYISIPKPDWFNKLDFQEKVDIATSLDSFLQLLSIDSDLYTQANIEIDLHKICFYHYTSGGWERKHYRRHVHNLGKKDFVAYMKDIAPEIKSAEAGNRAILRAYLSAYWEDKK